MDYEKKYKQALDWAKSAIEAGANGMLKEDLEYIFPELAESEDERIRKAIKYGLDYVFTNNTTVYETTKERCLAWLEKQGEQKPILDIEVPFGAKDSDLKEVTYDIPKGYHAEIEDNKVVIKKGEKKAAEWSEEDEKMIDAIYSCVDAHYEGLAKESLLIWLKFLRPQSHWRPSEAQMKWLHDAIESTQYEPRKQALISLYSDLMELKG